MIFMVFGDIFVCADDVAILDFVAANIENAQQCQQGQCFEHGDWREDADEEK